MRLTCLILAILLHASVRAADLSLCSAPIAYGLVDHGYLYDMASDRGIDRDIATELARRSGCTFVYLARSRARVWHEFESGSLDMVGASIQTPERAPLAWFANYAAIKNFALVRENLHVRSAQEFLADQRLLWGIVRAYRHGQHTDAFLAQLRERGRLIEENDIRGLFRLLERGKVDGIFAQSVVFAKFFAENPPPMKIRTADWFPDEPPVIGGIAISKRRFSASAAAQWRALIEQMRADGTLQAIFVRYVGAAQAEHLLHYKQVE